MTKYNILFNFSASYSGGGFKRLHAYAQWFNAHGGARFIIHPRCASLVNEFENNHFRVVSPTRLQRILNDGAYLKKIKQEWGVPDLYYAYGIPVYYPIGRLNWFHLSNVLPLGSRGIPLPILDRMKLALLGYRIKQHFKHADIISAESSFSLDLIHARFDDKKFVSVNGSDDEVLFDTSRILKEDDGSLLSTLPTSRGLTAGSIDEIAVVLGTYQYKALEDSYHVFEMLQKKNSDLKLVIIGDEKKVPAWLLSNSDTIMTGMLPRDEVLQYLKRATYYISTTHIENSYNAASEGIFFARESYISDIGPHRELVILMPYETVSIPHMTRPMLHLKRELISPQDLKTWDEVVLDMLEAVSMAPNAP